MTAFSGFRAFMRRRPIAWPLFVVAGAGVVYCVAWIATAVLLKGQIDSWAAQQRAAGATVNYGDPLIGGFPDRVEIALPAWELAAPKDAGGWIWRSTAPKVWAKPWRPFAFTVDLSGRHTIAGIWTPPAVAAAVNFDHAEVRPVLVGGGRLRAVNIEIKGARVAAAADAEATPLVTVDVLTLVAEPRGDETPEKLNAWHLGATVESLKVPAAKGLAPFSREVRRAAFDADLVGPVAPGPLKESLDAWRKGGGTVNLRELAIDWPPLSVSGAATVSLDDRLQPIGAGSVKFRGFFETIDGLVQAEAMRPSAASMARIVLGLLSRTPPGGGAPELSISVTMQDNKLFAGPLTLLEIDPIDWDAAAVRAVPILRGERADPRR